jgi:hypothetical protein
VVALVAFGTGGGDLEEALEELDNAIEIGVAAAGAAKGFAIVAEVAKAGFVENALAEVRRAVGVREFAPGGEFFGDGQKGFAVACDDVLGVSGVLKSHDPWILSQSTPLNFSENLRCLGFPNRDHS